MFLEKLVKPAAGQAYFSAVRMKVNFAQPLIQQRNAADVRPFVTRDDFEHGSFARPVRPEYYPALARSDIPVHAVQNLHISAIKTYAFKFYLYFSHRISKIG